MGPQPRGVALVAPATAQVEGLFTKCNFTLKNTGTAAATDAALHPQDAGAYLNCDIYRLSVSINGQGWSVQLQNELAAVKFGDAKTIPVYVSRKPGSAPSATVTLKAASQSDPTKTTTATFTVKNY